MSDISHERQSVELLQQLGLKKYEAECFVALTRLPDGGTAKEISDITDVPRTRVYDATRILEAQGLVEIQHTSPQRFRALSIDEATATLRRQYESKVDDLGESLRRLEPEERTDDGRPVHEVWSLSGTAAIESRTRQLVDDADEEVVLLVDDASASERLLDALAAAAGREVDVTVGTTSESSLDRVREAAPDADVIRSGLEWLHGSSRSDPVVLSQVLLVDRNTLLVSSRGADDGSELSATAIYGCGFDNGFVVIVRRLLTAQLRGLDGRTV
ncbi:TrmB family transcriptional regulator [Halegenticoccus soli]|uniref:TrmB family transcriptional regulator n=1 Tax=Halegenticoccus soli TaxID=1985678 RepID=UPI000C6EC857|nr:helix-turn-helix domain-containing protein [Halegenticoccus soli]